MSTLEQFGGKDASSNHDYTSPDSVRVLQLVLPPGAVDPLAEEHGAEAPLIEAVTELQHREANYRRWLAAGDAVAVTLATLVATFTAGDHPRWWVLCVPIFAVLVAKIDGLYDRDDQVILKSSFGEWRRILRAAAVISMGLYLSWRWITTAAAGGGMREFLYIGSLCFFATIVFRSLARRAARITSPPERCVIVGDPRNAHELAAALSGTPGVELVGMVHEDQLGGSVAELHHVAEELGFHRLVIAPSNEPNDSTLHLIQAAKYIGVRVTLVPSVMTAVGGFAVIEELEGMTLLGVPRFGLSRSSMALKRAFDLLIGAIALVLLSPVMLLIAIFIKCDSQGPVLFTQTRIGRDGRPFKILKFRSMVDGADAMKPTLLLRNEAVGGLFKISEDPRITRVGRRIRASHLDELPQLLNVLAGQMSLVGPRPLIAEEDALVTGRDRHRVRLIPGMTGPWQIKGPMNADLPEMAMLDYRYASSWTIWSDVDILARTTMRVLRRAGH